MANSNGWKALLYYQNNSFIISDPKFYIAGGISLEAELEAFVREMSKEGRQEIICRFPARFTFMASQMGLPADLLNNCSGLEDFRKRAPLDRAYVMFASENISIPSSMMGHIYLKLAGANHQKEDVEHAISFYTDVDGFNFPKLVIESLLLGKKGYYALTPSEPIKSKYILQEGRNVWEYELNLTKEEKTLLHYHLYEMRGIKLTYFFHTFNCATLIKQILVVAKPQSATYRSEWTTPLDVIRFMNEHELIATQAVNLSKKWKIKSLLDSGEFNRKTVKEIKNNDLKEIFKRAQEVDENDSFKLLELSKAYNGYLFENSEISKEESFTNIEELNDFAFKNHPEKGLDFSNYKNPRKTKSTTQLMVTFAREKEDSIYKITWLPASHFLEDDSSNYLSESELQVSRLTFGYNENRGSLYVDEFNVYSSTSFQPTDLLTGGLSGKFRLGYENYFNSEFERKKSIVVDGSVGKTFRVHNDIDSYFLVGLNYLSGNDVMISPDVETGLILRAILHMKTILNVNYTEEDILKNKRLVNYQLKHFIDLGPYGLLFESDNIQNQSSKFIHNYSISFKKYF